MVHHQSSRTRVDALLGNALGGARSARGAAQPLEDAELSDETARCSTGSASSPRTACTFAELMMARRRGCAPRPTTVIR